MNSSYLVHEAIFPALTHLPSPCCCFPAVELLLSPCLTSTTMLLCVCGRSVCISQKQTAVKTPVHHFHRLPLFVLLVLFLSGWFCVSAAWNSQPFDLDNYTNANCLCPATSTGGRCQVGFYCPLGSQEPLPCPPGAFCNISGTCTLMISYPHISMFPGNVQNPKYHNIKLIRVLYKI